MTNPFNRFRPPADATPRPFPPASDDSDEALEALIEKGRELFAQARVYSAAQLDKGKLMLRQILVMVFLFFLAVLGLAGLLVGASHHLLDGMAGGFAALTGKPWLGDLLAGLVAMGLVFGGYYIGMRKFEQSRIAKLKQKYEQSDAQSNGGQRIAERPTTPAH